MEVLIIAVGKFEFLDGEDTKVEIKVDLNAMHDSGETFDSIITEAFEERNSEGCSCTFSESQNHCDCDGHGYEYEYMLYEIKQVEKYEEN